MKFNGIIMALLLSVNIGFAQTYDSLYKLDDVSQKVYYSKTAKHRALKIVEHVAKADNYFSEQFNASPNYTLLVLSPDDWKIYAHPNAIYGIPHYLPDGGLIVASENNEFWKRNTPPVDKLPEEFAQKLKNTYADKNGEVSLMDFFDLLAIHELGHAFQKAVGMNAQRNWLSELLCNVLLHTYVAENSPGLLPSLTVFPEVSVATFPQDRLKYTKLEDFETHYGDLAQNHPDNYGWYQCRFHATAGKIYDSGGVATMKSMWDMLSSIKTKLDNEELAELMHDQHPTLERAINNWDK